MLEFLAEQADIVRSCIENHCLVDIKAAMLDLIQRHSDWQCELDNTLELCGLETSLCSQGL